MEEFSSKKWVWVGLAVFVLLLIAGGLFWFFGRGSSIGAAVGKIFPFGAETQGNTMNSGDGTSNEHGARTTDGGKTITQESLFRQLASVPIAGASTIQRAGVEYVRYVEKGTGHTYEVNLTDGVARQLTNTTIPRIALADWANDGNAVILRTLEKEELSGRDVIKTYLGRLPMPTNELGLNASSTPSPDHAGDLTVEFLPDNIVALSVAGDGKDLFYLTKIATGVIGSIMNLSTKTTKVVFQNAFSEWLPQLLDDDTVLLTTKPSSDVPGYSYRYDQKRRTFERFVREKNGLTTLGTASGSRMLYGETLVHHAVLGVYSPSGFIGDEGVIAHEKTVPIGTLPEKCAWRSDGIRLLCGAFTTTPESAVPDLWYQGKLSFNDTFWSANTDTDEVTFLADPKTEIQREFDVINPLISPNEDYFIFTNKKDDMLWSMRILQKVPGDPSALPANLSPEELQDAQGGMPKKP